MALMTYSASITTTGSAGSATGTGTLSVRHPGYLEWVDINYHASAPATTDVTGTMAAAGAPPGEVLFTSSDTATDVLQFPRGVPVNLAGSAITNAHTRVMIGGDIAVAVAQSDALTGAVVVTIGVWTP